MKSRLCILYFLQFAVWGCYLTSLGQFLGGAGLGAQIAWFYAAIGLVSLLTPALFGYLADKLKCPARLLALCHLSAGAIMLLSFYYSIIAPRVEFSVFYPLYLLFLSFYMPTMALANTTTFAMLREAGKRPVDSFPSIRIWGTIGFIAAMWWVNTTFWDGNSLGWTFSDQSPEAMLRFQYNAGQLCCSGIIGLICGLYTFTLPRIKNFGIEEPRQKFILPSRSGLNSLKDFFRLPYLRVFLIFAALTGVCLQISNGYATSFITHFMGDPAYSGMLASGNATLLFSISQISEAVLILIVGISLAKLGIRTVIAVGAAAWSLRFLLLAFGNPGDGLWMLVLSMIVYGVAFNFITIGGHLYIDQKSPAHRKGFGQGAMMLMSNGIGATIGMICAGAVVNRWCSWQPVNISETVTTRLFMGDWTIPWIIFTAYSALIALAWLIATIKNPAPK